MRDTIPMRRFGTPEDIAAATVWLCSDDAAYVTGQVLPVEGAYSTSAITIVSSSDFVRRI
jgi:NAD(P)-dependent dehydrogenase (short-subunit alcohol dehydrogenase family)